MFLLVMDDPFEVGLTSLDYWRLCDELTIIQASLLVAGHDPSSIQYFVESNGIEQRPLGYEAVKAALSRALLKKSIKGHLCPLPDYDINGHYTEFVEGSIDLERSVIEVADLKIWLTSRAITTGFFFPTKEAVPDFLDPKNARYSPKLAASVTAWFEMEKGGLLKGKSVKQSLEKWLRLNAGDFGLCDEEGKPNETGIQECAKVANWNPAGGAPKTPS